MPAERLLTVAANSAIANLSSAASWAGTNDFASKAPASRIGPVCAVRARSYGAVGRQCRNDISGRTHLVMVRTRAVG